MMCVGKWVFGLEMSSWVCKNSVCCCCDEVWMVKEEVG